MLNKELQAKYDKLIQILKDCGSLLVGYSGGVDSTFLAKAAYDALGDNAVAITGLSASYSQRELKDARDFAKQIGIKHIELDSNELLKEEFLRNDTDRCYHCKKALFTEILNMADKLNMAYVAEASNIDDEGDYRPGLSAAAELKIRCPLREAGLTKDEIRLISKELGLPSWDKPAFACLSSRVPYGTRIDAEKLSMIERAESVLFDLGFKQPRVRHHGSVARIEVSKEEMAAVLKSDTANRIYLAFKEIGFDFTALDILGYRTGSLNETFLQK
ncbi:MAG: ATP-dependent sacrificial sulfur transferase LarE [Christensenellales bacterium]|jgi:uncharacterized protein